MVRIPILALAVLATAGPATARQVVRHPDPSESLAERWSWALDACGATDCVVGYAITRRMHAEDRMGWIGDWKESRRTLADLLSGGAVPQPSRQTGIVDKPVAILLRLGSGDREPRDVHGATFDSWVDLKGATFVWLGPADLAESFSFLDARFDAARGEDARRSLVWTVGLHQLEGRVVPWLSDVAMRDDASDVRKAAAYSLGEQDGPEALLTLGRIVSADASIEVRKAALYAAAEFGGPDAFRLLSGTARSAGAPTEVRKAAIYALGETDSDEVRTLLIDIAMGGGRP